MVFDSMMFRRACSLCASLVLGFGLIGTSACIPGLPAQCESCGLLAGFIQTPDDATTTTDPTVTPAPVNQGTACSLNAGAGVISAAETSFAITSVPNAAGADGANAIVADYDSIYIGGFEQIGVGDLAWRIEKRDRVTGALDAAFGAGGAVTSNPGGQIDAVGAMAIDASGLYIVGPDRSPGVANSQWRIEKRDRITGALITAFGTAGVITENISPLSDIARGIALNGNALFIVGSYGISAGNVGWRIEKRDLTTGNLIVTFNATGFIDSPAGGGLLSEARSVALDVNFLYITGTSRAGDDQWRIEKRNLGDGALVPAFDGDGRVEVNPSGGSDNGLSIRVDATSVFISGTDTTGAGQYTIEKRDIVTGAYDIAFDGDGILNIDPSVGLDQARSIVLNNNDLYFGGLDAVPTNGQFSLSKYTKAAGTAVAAFDGDGTLQINQSPGNDQFNDFCVDSGFVYAVGDTGTGPAQDWHIVKRNKTTAL